MWSLLAMNQQIISGATNTAWPSIFFSILQISCNSSSICRPKPYRSSISSIKRCWRIIKLIIFVHVCINDIYLSSMVWIHLRNTQWGTTPVNAPDTGIDKQVLSRCSLKQVHVFNLISYSRHVSQMKLCKHHITWPDKTSNAVTRPLGGPGRCTVGEFLYVWSLF